MTKKIFLVFLTLLIAFLCCAPAAAAAELCTVNINTKEAGNTVYLYRDNAVKYTGVSDKDGKIVINNVETGQYKAVFKDGNYQSFEFSLPYENSNVITANPKPVVKPQGPVIEPGSQRGNHPSDGSPNSNNNANKNNGERNIARPKVNEYEIEIIWETNNIKQPEYITVSVFIDNVFYKTVKISKADGWKKTISVKDGKITVTTDDLPAGCEAYVTYGENKAVIKIYNEGREKIPYTGSETNYFIISLFLIGMVTLMLTKKKNKCLP